MGFIAVAEVTVPLKNVTNDLGHMQEEVWQFLMNMTDNEWVWEHSEPQLYVGQTHPDVASFYFKKMSNQVIEFKLRWG